MAIKLLCLAFALFCAASAAPESRIVGGTPTTIEDFPYIVAIVYHYPRPNIHIQRCVGSLVSSWHVLTTAFCFTGADVNNMLIRAGSTNSMSGGVESRIAEVIKHPNYVETPRSADIAVVRVTEPFRISDSINVLFIPPPGTFLPDGMLTKVVSWGFESESGPQLETLKTVNLIKLPFADCQKIFEGAQNVTIDEAMLCASAPGKGICRGDSGAPMVHNSVLIGLSSFFKVCDSDDYPDVFTRIDSYTDWIMDAASDSRSVSPIRVANF
ncbi:unnamed protein product, partial [Brenthis ino]